MLAIIIHAFIITTIAVVWKQKSPNAPLKAWIIPGLLLKFLAGLAVGWLFLRYYGYGGDSWNMHQNARQISTLAHQDLGAYLQFLFFNKYHYFAHLQDPTIWEQPRYLFVVKVVSLINLATQQSYWLTSFYFSLFAFSGLWQVANTLSRLFPTTKLAAAFAFLLFPSVLFWSSGLQKESLALGIMAWLIHWFLSIFCDPGRSSWLRLVKISFFSLLGLYGLWKLKFYYFGGLVPILTTIALAYWVYAQLKTRQNRWSTLWLPFILFMGIFGTLSLMASFAHPKLHLSEFMQVLVLNHNASFNFSNPDDVIYYYRTGGGLATLTSTIGNLLYNSPLALVSGLFRPFVWEANNHLKLVVSLEHCWILIMTFYALFSVIKKRYTFKGHPLHIKLVFLLIGAVVYIGLLATLLALASPNFGTLSRYKVGFLPILLYLIHIPLNFQVNKWLPQGNKVDHN